MCLYPIKIMARPHDALPHAVSVSCGKCLECVRQKSVEWAFRIMDECSLYKDNSFLTLTYDDEHKPYLGVSRREVQLFVKRLRKVLFPRKIRFFACGEYGKKLGRPHYHLIIFNWFPDDAWFWQRDKSGVELFRSSLLETVWTFGFSSVGRVTYDSALYCAKYMNKYAWQDSNKRVQVEVQGEKTPFFDKMNAPFVQMSNRPGIGFDCVYKADLVSDRIYRSGKSTKIPRYYLKVMERDGVFLDEFKVRRQKQGELIAKNTDLQAKRDFYWEKFLSKKFLKK